MSFIKNPDFVVYLDLDEVLVDFDSVATKIFPQFHEMNDFFYKGTGSILKYNRLLAKLVFEIKQVPDFWVDLPWTKDGKDLWQFVKNNIKKENIAILTAPLTDDPRCKDQKWQWVQDNLKTISQDHFICETNKSDFVNKFPGKYQILIDDRPKNINKWKEKGGIGILHKSAEESIQELQKLLNHD